MKEEIQGNSEVLLECEDLYKDLGLGDACSHVLRGISIEVRRGEVCAIAGPSGCGKSTLLYLLGLLDKPDAGEIRLNGQPMTQSTEQVRSETRSRHLGFVFQFHFLLPEFSALENIMLPMRKTGRWTIGQMESRAMEYLQSVGLEDLAQRLPSQLSGGEQQRVAIARALVNDPLVLLADEPTGNLDERATRGVLQLLRDINATGTAVVMATHDLALVRSTSYRTIELKDGALVHDTANQLDEEELAI